MDKDSPTSSDPAATPASAQEVPHYSADPEVAQRQYAEAYARWYQQYTAYHQAHPESPAAAAPQPAVPAPETKNLAPESQSKQFGTFEIPAANSAAPAAEVASTEATSEPPAEAEKPHAVAKKPAQNFWQKLKTRVSGDPELPSRLKPLVTAGVVGVIIFAIFNSQIILGQVQYLTNPNASSATSQQVGPEPLVIIPKINVTSPVVYDEPSFEEQRVQAALERGVVHYGNTAVPGQAGNNVIVGHSSNNWWAGGKYKFAFVLLNKLEKGDTFTLHYDGKKYVYEVFEKKIVDPTDISVLSQQTDTPITTLITCDPPGTSWKRLIVQGRQIEPTPASQPAGDQAATPPDESALPGNTPSIIDKIRQWIGS